MRRNTLRELKTKRTHWIDVRRATKEDIEHVLKPFPLTPDHLDAVLKPSHRSRLFEGEEYLLLIWVYPRYDSDVHDVIYKEINFLLTTKTLVTVQHHATPEITALFHHVDELKGSPAMKHPARLLGYLLNELSRGTYDMLDVIARRSDGLERDLYKKRQDILPSILATQTNIIDIRKLVEGDEIILDRMITATSGSTRNELARQAEELKHRAREVQINLQTELETAQALHRAHESLLNTKTNRLIRILTILSLILMPSTLLAGIFGMNTVDPWLLGVPSDFTIIIGIMILSAIALYAVVRIEKW